MSDSGGQAWREAIESLGREDRVAAAAALDRLLLENSDHVHALDLRGAIALGTGEYALAASVLERVVALAPERLRAWINFADALLRCGRAADAEAVLARAPEVLNTWPPAIFVRGRIHWAQGRIRPALEDIDLAALQDPAIESAIDHWAMSRLLVADWDGWDSLARYLRSRVLAGRAVCQPLTLMHLSDSPAELLQCARTETARFYPSRPVMLRPGSRRPGRIRLAYLSSDLNDHPVGHQIAGVLERHDRTLFEVVAVSLTPPVDDAISARLGLAADILMDVSNVDDEAAARQIAAMDINVLIGLNGYTARCRPGILAHRPARVQVNAIGFPGSMGAPYMDYILADAEVIPPQEASHYSEAIAFMPYSYQSTDDRVMLPHPGARADEGLPEDAFVFANLSKTTKISPHTFGLWMAVLRQTPRSVLWLMSPGAEGRSNLIAAAKAHDVDPDRLVFAAPARRERHVARHGLADLMLDTLPYNAHSTASDALWAGLPVLTRRGDAFPGRVCSSVLRAAGLEELITTTDDGFVRTAAELAADQDRLKKIRERIAGPVRHSPLFYTAGYVRDLETAYRRMLDRALAGEAPETFHVGEVHA